MNAEQRFFEQQVEQQQQQQNNNNQNVESPFLLKTSKSMNFGSYLSFPPGTALGSAKNTIASSFSTATSASRQYNQQSEFAASNSSLLISKHLVKNTILPKGGMSTSISVFADTIINVPKPEQSVQQQDTHIKNSPSKSMIKKQQKFIQRFTIEDDTSSSSSHCNNDNSNLSGSKGQELIKKRNQGSKVDEKHLIKNIEGNQRDNNNPVLPNRKRRILLLSPGSSYSSGSSPSSPVPNNQQQNKAELENNEPNLRKQICISKQQIETSYQNKSSNSNSNSNNVPDYDQRGHDYQMSRIAQNFEQNRRNILIPNIEVQHLKQTKPSEEFERSQSANQIRKHNDNYQLNVPIMTFNNSLQQQQQVLQEKPQQFMGQLAQFREISSIKQLTQEQHHLKQQQHQQLQQLRQHKQSKRNKYLRIKNEAEFFQTYKNISQIGEEYIKVGKYISGMLRRIKDNYFECQIEQLADSGEQSD